MKSLLRLLLFALALVISREAFSQQVIHEKIYSRYLQDTVHYQVIIPEGRRKDKQLPVLYAVKYGMIDGEYIASQLRYFKSARYRVLDMIVVTILADMDRIGFIYKTGQLTGAGLKFVNCLKNELIPEVSANYNTAAFNAYIGHSYAASYANYLLQHEPGLFNGYILLGPEAVGIDFQKPLEGQAAVAPFSLNEKAVDFYNRSHTFYYVAVGESDLERRHAYARDILRRLNGLNGDHFQSKYDSIPRGDHGNILTMAIQPALEFISRHYSPDADPDPEWNAWESLTSLESRLQAIYGLGVEKSFSWYGRFAQLAIDQKDTTTLLRILDHFSSDELKAYDLRTFGQYCVQLGLKDHAESYYRAAIGQLLGSATTEPWETSVLTDCYYRLATDIEKDRPDQAWQYLQKALKLAGVTNKYGGRNIDIYYLAGAYAIDRNYHLREGIGYLTRYLALRANTIDEIHYSYERIYTSLGKGYYLLKDKRNARTYLEKAIALNQNNDEVKQLLAKL